jgi:ribonuclease BN (tRNA processing enzyme)
MEKGKAWSYRSMILGSGTCVPSLRRSSSSVLVFSGNENLLVDVGPGTMQHLLEAGFFIDDIDAILLSHFHPDHAGELASFLFATKYPEPPRRNTHLRIIGGTGLHQLYKRLNQAFDLYLDLPSELFSIQELNAEGNNASMLRDFSLHWSEVKHRPESRAYRLETASGYSLVYSGDTDYSEELIRLSEGADLLICELAFPDGKKVPGHLTPSLAGEIAAKAGVSHLILTHFYPECEDADIFSQCRSTYNGPLSLAEDLMQIDLLKK